MKINSKETRILETFDYTACAFYSPTVNVFDQFLKKKILRLFRLILTRINFLHRPWKYFYKIREPRKIINKENIS